MSRRGTPRTQPDTNPLESNATTWRLGPTLIYIGSVFISAVLLFSIQPLVAGILLPRWGGTPAVWNTALVFFQVALLIGYAYAHWLPNAFDRRRALMIHAVVLLLPILALPPAAVDVGSPEQPPALLLLLTLTFMVGLPFFVLATNSSLVQRWFSESGLAGGHEPYRLYAASNVGSVLGLLAYPFVIQPLWGFREQAWHWSWGYGVFAAVTLGVMWHVGRRGASSAARGADDPESEEVPASATAGSSASDVDGGRSARGPARVGGSAGAPAAPHRATGVPWIRRLGWLARAAVASSLLLGATMLITTDIAPVPLLWVVPLLIYLATFIVAFGRVRPLPRPWLAGAAALFGSLALIQALFPLLGNRIPTAIALGLPLLTLTSGAMLCHRDLAADRPAPRHLTDFYLWVAAGGALGGVLNQLVAPALLETIGEWPLTLAALAIVIVRPPRREPAIGARTTTTRWAWLYVPMTAVAVAWAALGAAQGSVGMRQLALFAPALMLLIGLELLWFGHRIPYAMGVALVALLVTSGRTVPLTVLAQERSFFGVHRVVEDESFRFLVHGTTVHGSQPLDAGANGRYVPGLYFHPRAPLGRLVTAAPAGGAIGVIGLGSGALAALTDPGQSIWFFEIDPVVERLARTHFAFIDQAPGDVQTVIGDGRLTVEHSVGPGTFDLLVVDAFSSDAIPTHLLTREAVNVYRSRIKPRGLLAIHTSNRHLALPPLVAGLAAEAGMHGAVIRWTPDATTSRAGASQSEVVVLAETTDALETWLATDGVARTRRPGTDDGDGVTPPSGAPDGPSDAGEPGWRPLAAAVSPDRRVVWTDDDIDLLEVVEW